MSDDQKLSLDDVLARPALGPTSGSRIGNGIGWGGPARGPGTGGPPPVYTGRDYSLNLGSRRTELKKQRAEEMEDILYGIASSPLEESKDRINAATRLHEMYEGLPVSRQLIATANVTANLSDAELTAELARLSRATVGYIEGTSEETVPPEPNGVV